MWNNVMINWAKQLHEWVIVSMDIIFKIMFGIKRLGWEAYIIDAPRNSSHDTCACDLRMTHISATHREWNQTVLDLSVGLIRAEHACYPYNHRWHDYRDCSWLFDIGLHIIAELHPSDLLRFMLAYVVVCLHGLSGACNVGGLSIAL